MAEQSQEFRALLYTELGTLRTEFRAEIGELRNELHAEIGQLRTDIRNEFHAELGGLRSEFHTEIGKLAERVEQPGDRVEQRYSDLIKWSFVFWVGSVVTLMLGMAAIERYGR